MLMFLHLYSNSSCSAQGEHPCVCSRPFSSLGFVPPNRLVWCYLGRNLFFFFFQGAFSAFSATEGLSCCCLVKRDLSLAARTSAVGKGFVGDALRDAAQRNMTANWGETSTFPSQCVYSGQVIFCDCVCWLHAKSAQVTHAEQPWTTATSAAALITHLHNLNFEGPKFNLFALFTIYYHLYLAHKYINKSAYLYFKEIIWFSYP